jgi:hypothetical protein
MLSKPAVVIAVVTTALVLAATVYALRSSGAPAQQPLGCRIYFTGDPTVEIIYDAKSRADALAKATRDNAKSPLRAQAAKAAKPGDPAMVVLCDPPGFLADTPTRKAFTGACASDALFTWNTFEAGCTRGGPAMPKTVDCAKAAAVKTCRASSDQPCDTFGPERYEHDVLSSSADKGPLCKVYIDVE